MYDPIALGRMFIGALCAATCGATMIEVPQGKYTRHRGYLSQGADLVNGTMTLSRAQSLCDALPECSGITFAADLEKLPRAGSSSDFFAHVWLKGFDEWVPFKGHVTLLKNLKACEHLKFVQYQALSAGPYCCEGKGCPQLADYGTAEVRCRLPAMAPFGVPLCSNLRGTPLKNIAMGGKATASSEYPYAENAGAAAAIDGSTTNSKIFHSRCDKGPQSWRVSFDEPMQVFQIALHNRKDFRSRLYSSTVRALAHNGSTVAAFTVRTAREVYIWSVRPPVRDVVAIEIRTAKAEGCLHFTELEAFGEAHSQAGQTSFRELPEATPPKRPAKAIPQAVPQASQHVTSSRGAADTARQDVQARQEELAAAKAGVAKAGAGKVEGAGSRAAQPSGSSGASTPKVPPSQVPAAAPTPRPGRGVAGHGTPSRGTSTRPSVSDEGAESIRTPRTDDEEPFWLATTGTLTAAVMLAFQYVWVKVRWIDIWS